MQLLRVQEEGIILGSANALRFFCAEPSNTHYFYHAIRAPSLSKHES